jgi:EAL domain-containing protein (putative c-di-GMP-specific phosphodiesterase class I)/GGDEF domain-containing protein
MPSLLKVAAPPLSPVGEPTASERFTRALVALTRTVWHPDCTFETAIASICETAAKALQVERVSVWSYEVDQSRLRCLHAYDAGGDGHVAVDRLETLSLEGDDYIAALEDVRTFEAAEIDADPAPANSHRALRDYLQRHRVHAMLDAPAFVGGELQGVISHESVLRVRAWSREEATFAASMGDYVAMAFEIARRRRAEAEVEHLRLHDAGTGLPNRDYMTELVRQRLAAPLLGDEVPTVLHVLVNATGGIAWSAGAPTVDDVMARIAHRLRSFTGIGVELARTRADGFSFLITASPAKRTVIRLAEGVLTALKSMEWAHGDVDPSATIGIALADDGAAHDARVLLRQGEEAAEQARNADRFGYAIFDHEHHATLVEAMQHERTLREAFATGKFEVHYQPEYDAGTRQWVAAESLLRWRNGERLVVAGEFIGVVESSGLMLPVGRWVLKQACHDAVGWPPRADGQPVAVRVNVSARQFDEPGLVDDVDAALQASGLDPARLCLELTETTLMRDIDHALEILRHLRELGVQLAIDDFGTGYASLVYLKRLPIDVLKIDRSFVQGMPDIAADLAIIQAIVALATAFRIDVVAEGVELPKQQDALLELGVHRMQGWMYGKAMANQTLCEFLGTRFGA